MPGRWRATGCGIRRYHRRRALRSLFFYAVYTHSETVAEIAKVLLQRRFSGFAGLKAIRFPGGLAHRPPAFDASPMVCNDLNNIDYSHTASLLWTAHLPCAVQSTCALSSGARMLPPFSHSLSYNKMR